ncbi:serine hydrolase FSH [Stachybotrys elegans]|uniref:Serine hydrolase FSH n=1 Tax=Stachybotrys elegans TaxID=80388 RepID=A0A8K0SW77_9HYPO|nr:serine hydrolase FSH [Stachybotrys elegans]
MNDDLSIPRILCIHGGGTNKEIFALQARGIVAGLQPYFRLVFVNGPWTASPHASIAGLFGDMGPFYRWLRWLPEHEPIDDEAAANTVMNTIRDAMKKDEGTGPWAGVMGISQGGKIAANLLWEQERAAKHGLPPLTNFKFGLIMAALPPWMHFDTRLPLPEKYVETAGCYASEWKKANEFPTETEGEHILTLPTLHVLGLQDPDVDEHLMLTTRFCKKESTEVYKWDGGHRVPTEPQHVKKIVNSVLYMADKTDMLW